MKLKEIGQLKMGAIISYFSIAFNIVAGLFVAKYIPMDG